MGEIIVKDQKFKIKGDEPDNREQLAIDLFFKRRDQGQTKTGNPVLDGEAQFDISPMDVMSEADFGKYNKNTESYLNSPSFGRLVTEVGLSIAGGIAGAAFPVAGIPILLSRVARFSRPLLNISQKTVDGIAKSRTVARVGTGTAGAAAGGASGAALSQVFDPREDIVREVTRGALQGGLGELAGFGLAGGLAKIYNKVKNVKLNGITNSKQAFATFQKEKRFLQAIRDVNTKGLNADEIAKLSKPTDAAFDDSLTEFQLKILTDKSKQGQAQLKKIYERVKTRSPELLAKLDDPTGFFPRTGPGITAGQMFENSTIDFLQNISASSLTGGAIREGQLLGRTMLQENFETMVEGNLAALKAANIPPTVGIGAILNKYLTDSKGLFDGIRAKANNQLAKAVEELGPAEIYNVTGKGAPYDAAGKLKTFNANLVRADGGKGVVKAETGLRQFIDEERIALAQKFPRDPKKATTGVPPEISGVLDQVGAYLNSATGNISAKRLLDLRQYLNTVVRNNPNPYLKTFYAEAYKRVEALLNQTPIPAGVGGALGATFNTIRQTADSLNTVNRELFTKNLIAKFLDSPSGHEALYKKIVQANDASVTNAFFDMLDTKVKIGGKLVPAVPRAEIIKDSVRAQFFKEFSEAGLKDVDNYTILDSKGMFRFLEKNKNLLDNSNLLTKTQIKNLREYSNAARFVEGAVKPPGITGKGAGTVFIQLKQAGAITQLGALTIGAASGESVLPVATIVLGLPYAFSRIISDPRATKLLLSGVRGEIKSYPKFRSTISQLTSGLVGQGALGPIDQQQIMSQLEQQKPALEAAFAGNREELLKNINIKPKNTRPADEKELSFTEIDMEAPVVNERAKPVVSGVQMPNVQPSNVGALFPNDSLSQQIAANQSAQPVRLSTGGILDAKKI
tara:strand:+ start:755 stop:3487 length:2733 start_codon:yes stop_codon:yes gene_type:complete